MRLILKVLRALLAVCILIGTNSVFTSTGSKQIILIVLIGILGLNLFFEIMATVLIDKTKVKISTVNFMRMLITTFLLLMYLIAQNQYISQTDGVVSGFILPFLFWFLMVVYLNVVDWKPIVKALVTVVALYSFVSVFFWLFGSTLGLIQPSGTINFTWGGMRVIPSYHNVYFRTQGITLLGVSFTRNSGIWAEGPMYAMILTFAWLLQSFLVRNLPLILKVGLVAAIITTFSASGWFFFVLITILAFPDQVKKIGQGGAIVIIVLAIVVAAIAMPYIHSLFLEKTSSISASIRLDDIKAGFESWIHHLFFGNGPNNNGAISAYMDYSLRTVYSGGDILIATGLANSYVAIFSDGGVVLGAFYLYPLVVSLFQTKGSNAYAFKAMAIIVALMLAFFIMTYTPLLLFMLALFLIPRKGA